MEYETYNAAHEAWKSAKLNTNMQTAYNNKKGVRRCKAQAKSIEAQLAAQF